MTRVILAIKTGVYRHEVLGAFLDLDEAISLAKEFVVLEGDHYHCVELVRVEGGKLGEESLGVVEAAWEHIPQDGPPGAVPRSSHRKEYRGVRWVPVEGQK
jgi:hypothetical protein